MPEDALFAIEDEGGQGLAGEGAGEPILPEEFVPPPRPPIPPVPTPPVIALCPAVECCPINPYSYSIDSTAGNPPKLSIDNTTVCSVCYGIAFSTTITATGLGVGLTWTITGALPTGLTFHGGYNENGNVVIDGTPSEAGAFTCVITATTPNGVSASGTFTLNVVQITSTSAPTYTVGQPYFFQLTATGGSGNYGWSILSGSLPDGLVLNPISGLVYGTPTGINGGSSPVVFGVVDITCEQFNPVFTPQVSIVTSSNTSISTVLGYPEYIASSPPKKYHTLTWSGSAEQVCYNLNGPVAIFSQIADIRYVYSGSGTIDGQGHQISSYAKNMYLACPTSTFSPLSDSNIPSFQEAFPVMRGYCNPLDPQIPCGNCNFPALIGPAGQFPNWANMAPSFVGNVSGNKINDWPTDLFDGNLFTIVSSTQATLIGAPFLFQIAMLESGLGAAQNLHKSTINGLFTFWASVYTQYNLTATLSNEYTDAEALANAQIIISNGRTAEHFPRTTGFVSRETTVNYDLNCTGLVIGAKYVVNTFFVDNNGVLTHTTESFTASATTQVINHNIPQPSTPGATLTISYATIAFA